MTDALSYSQQHTFNPVTTFVAAAALVAALVLGFFAGTWTEPTSAPVAPGGSIHQVHQQAPEPLRKLGQNF